MTLVAHGAISAIVCLMMLFVFCIHTDYVKGETRSIRNKAIFKVALIYSFIYLFLLSFIPFLLLSFFSMIPYGLLLWIWLKFGIQAMLNDRFLMKSPYLQSWKSVLIAGRIYNDLNFVNKITIRKFRK